MLLKVSKGMKRKAFYDGGERCHYCGCPLTMKTATVDHVVPRSAGGWNHQANLVAACKPCNQAKGEMTAAEFMDIVVHTSWAHVHAMKHVTARNIKAKQSGDGK